MTTNSSRLAIVALALTGLTTFSAKAQVSRVTRRPPPSVPAVLSPAGNTIVMMNAPGPAPSNVAATVNSATTVTISWTTAAGATGYTINRSFAPSARSTTMNTQPVVGTMFTDTALFPRTTAYYSVTASYPNAGPGVSA